MYHNLEPLAGNNDADDADPLYGSQGRAFGTKVKQLFFAYGGICLAILCVIVVSITIGLTVHAYHARSPASYLRDGPIVTVTCGHVQGSFEDDAYVFKGIPYGVSPVAELRWKAPKSIDTSDECWGNQILQTINFSTPCFQYDTNKTKFVGSEDCLYLNVWTPSLEKDAGLDVMVYIHDGGLMTGSGNEPGLSPNVAIAKSLKKVFVSFNYRLNAFGFMALGALSWSNKNGHSGNFGLMDQTMVLRWVQHNIRQFGGNPDKVTVFGLGSGATSIFALLSTPEAKGLFHRAWLMSPSPKFEKSLNDAEEDNLDFLNRTGCMQSDPDESNQVSDCLRHLSPGDILAALPWDAWRNPHFQQLPEREETSRALALVDGVFVREQPVAAWKSNTANDVPLLIGNMAQEVASDATTPTTWPAYDAFIHRKLDPFRLENISRDALDLYPHQVSPEYQLSSMVSDLRAICGVNEITKVAANSSKSPVYRYVASPRLPDLKHHSAYSIHGMDARVFFGGAEALRGKPSKHDVMFAKNIRDVVRRFASEGTIEGWETFPNKTALGVLGSQQSGVYKEGACHFWREKGMFPEFAWIN